MVVIAAAVLLFVLFTALSGFVIDVLWFKEIGQEGVFWTTFFTRATLVAVFGAVFALTLWVNVVIARRLRPTTRVLTPDQEVIQRIRDLSAPLLRWFVPVGSALLGLFVGFGVVGNWEAFLMWRHSSGISFGDAEPLFGRDPAFYILRLPWLQFVQGWLFSSLVGITVMSGLAHVLWGGIRPQAPVFADKVTPAARAHLSVLLGAIMLVKAWGYYLGRFDLLSSPRGVVQGASYTDVNAQLPALNFLVIVALISALLFFLNIRLKQWSLPIISVGLLALVSVLLGTAYPAFVQRFRVEPNEQEYEAPYIAHNIAATRSAFALDGIEEQTRTVAGPLTAAQAQANDTTLQNIRLWRGDPVLLENFRSLQRIRQYYEFNDVDVDRYVVGGERRVIMVSPREISQTGIDPSGQTWQNLHLAYTHGYGAVAAQVNAATIEGQPAFTLENLPPEGEPILEQPRIYYGESSDVDYVVVGTSTQELDFEGATENQQYTGSGGIDIGSFFTRAMFAWEYRDYSLLVSGSIQPDSKILIRRDIDSRVRAAAPFLGLDADPYFAVVDGQPVWIWDAYAVTDRYPYSQGVDVGVATDGLLEGGQVNYIRNSVKVVVDAYDGTITYYADLTEPIVATWARVYPSLFTDIQTAGPSLEEHFRYPENLLQIQATQYANYHVQDPVNFYQKRDFWEVPVDPTEPVRSDGSVNRMLPYYQLLRLPGESTEDFRLVLPFVPAERLPLVAWMSASSDPDTYGQLTVYRYPEGRNIEGPSQVFARINQDPSFSSQRTLLSQAGSDVSFGDFLIIPVDDSLLYVQPVYVRAQQQTSVPELFKVVLVNGSSGDVSLGDSLVEALAAAVGEEEPPDGGEEPGGTVKSQIRELLRRAGEHFAAAEEALRAGDLASYQDEIEAAQVLVERAAELSGVPKAQGEEGASPTPTPASPAASPSPGG
jgi:hypothetical protein